MTECITIWVSKYALTKGILKVENAETSDDFPIIAMCGYVSYYGNDWHRTEAEAIARAEEMRVAKIKSLEKQITKLRAMTFGEKGND